MNKTRIFLFSLAFLWLNPALNAQIIVHGYFDLGKTQVSEGVYSLFSNIGYFEKAKWGVQSGYQLGLVQPQDVFFNSWYLSSYGKLKAGKIPLVLGGEYIWSAFSPDMRETNWIAFAGTTLKHWRFGFGTGIRTYRLSKKAKADPSLLDPDATITEKWNMIYHATYMLKPGENKWNLSGSFTNYDHFIIQQENNPMFNLRFDYKISNPVSLYSELWYRQAGWMVIKVTYYGMFIRLGVLWNL
jgi:hypothetical protein